MSEDGTFTIGQRVPLKVGDVSRRTSIWFSLTEGDR